MTPTSDVAPPEVQRVTVELKRPSELYPTGMMTFGYFTYVDNVVTMTDPKGMPAEDGNGGRYTQPAEPGFERVIACQLTRRLRDALRSGGVTSSAPKADFSSPIDYGNKRWRGV
ncbi:MAG: hypothetical protein WCD69_05815 [Xanthobacteraceae bacterium]